ncbi:MAG: Na/Pi cotransporter family protein [Dethiobacteria bacterium]|jgi:phosphate:Na+ symporter
MNWLIAMGTFGGLGMFLFGIQMMASGMQKIAGNKLKNILEVLTGKPIIGVVTGILVTVLVQSSSTTTVMLVGFVNAGLMTLTQAVSVIMGANIGTTITAQIISFKLDFLALPAVGIGSLLNFFGKRKFHRYFGQVVLGFGFLFLGMVTMSEAMFPLRESPLFLNLLVRFADYPLLGVLAATIFTAVIQSSSAATGIIIALTMQNILTIEAVVPLILGTNIGTCITALLASIGTSQSARKTAIAHVLFNLIGVVVFFVFLGPFTRLTIYSADTVWRQAANAHTFFNLVNTVLIFPFFKNFIRFINLIVPGEDVSIELGPKFLDKRMLKTPAVGIQAARQELKRMANIVREMVKDSIDVFCKGERKKIPHILQMEDLVDGLEKEINVYLQDLSQHSLTRQQSIVVSSIMSAANDLERIGDHAQNIVQLTDVVFEDRMPITPTAKKEVYSMFEKVDEMMEKTITALSEENIEIARQVVGMDDVVDNMEKVLRKNHIERVNRKECSATVGVIYLDILSNLERIADHSTNVSQIIVDEFI